MDESEQAFEARPCRVIGRAETAFLEEPCGWQPLAGGQAPQAEAIACVEDGATWHQFVPAVGSDDGEGRFSVVRFRFAEDGPNAIGFVAWLQSHLRNRGNLRPVPS